MTDFPMNTEWFIEDGVNTHKGDSVLQYFFVIVGL